MSAVWFEKVVGFYKKLKSDRPFEGTGAILPECKSTGGGGGRKMYSECMEKVGRLMLDNLRKVDMAQFL